MFDPLTVTLLIKLVANCASIAVTLYLTYLSFDRIREFWRVRRAMLDADSELLPFTVHERMAAGGFRTVYGVFDSSRGTAGDVVEAWSNEVDPELREIHKVHDVAVYGRDAI